MQCGHALHLRGAKWEQDRQKKCQNQLTFLNCMTRFIRLLVVALVDEEDVDV